MVELVEDVNIALHVRKKGWFPYHTALVEVTRVVIPNKTWSMLPALVEEFCSSCRTFASAHEVNEVYHSVRAQDEEDTWGQTIRRGAILCARRFLSSNVGTVPRHDPDSRPVTNC